MGRGRPGAPPPAGVVENRRRRPPRAGADGGGERAPGRASRIRIVSGGKGGRKSREGGGGGEARGLGWGERKDAQQGGYELQRRALMWKKQQTPREGQVGTAQGGESRRGREWGRTQRPIGSEPHAAGKGKGRGWGGHQGRSGGGGGVRPLTPRPADAAPPFFDPAPQRRACHSNWVGTPCGGALRGGSAAPSCRRWGSGGGSSGGPPAARTALPNAATAVAGAPGGRGPGIGQVDPLHPPPPVILSPPPPSVSPPQLDTCRWQRRGLVVGESAAAQLMWPPAQRPARRPPPAPKRLGAA